MYQILSKYVLPFLCDITNIKTSSNFKIIKIIFKNISFIISLLLTLVVVVVNGFYNTPKKSPLLRAYFKLEFNIGTKTTISSLSNILHGIGPVPKSNYKYNT